MPVAPGDHLTRFPFLALQGWTFTSSYTIHRSGMPVNWPPLSESDGFTKVLLHRVKAFHDHSKGRQDVVEGFGHLESVLYRLGILFSCLFSFLQTLESLDVTGRVSAF
jgi:hypothetical protein